MCLANLPTGHADQSRGGNLIGQYFNRVPAVPHWGGQSLIDMKAE